MTLVFLHGAGCTSSAFAAQRDAFPEAHAPDLPGHGCAGSQDSISGYARFVAEYLRSNNLRDAVLCGHSMGGAIALQAALDGVPLRGLVLLGSGARLRVAPAILEGVEADFEGTAGQIAAHFFADATTERVEAAIATMRLVGAKQTLLDFRACNAFDALERLGNISVPAIAITGEKDTLAPPKFALALADRVPGAQARIIPGAGHFVMAERPAETNEAIRTFLSGVL